jgi:hypothetical protein
MPYENYIVDKNVVGAGVRSLCGSSTSTLDVSGLIIRYSCMHFIKETLTRKSQTARGKMTYDLKCRTRIGLWNVRTLAQSGKLKQVCQEMENYKSDILGMSEVKIDLLFCIRDTMQMKDLFVVMGWDFY